MKVLLVLVLAVGLVAGVKERSVGFLETKTPEEYTPNPDGYLEEDLDLMYVLLWHIYEDPYDLSTVFYGLLDCNIRLIFTKYLSDFCFFGSDRGLYAVNTFYSYMLSEAYSCGSISTELTDEFDLFIGEWQNTYPAIAGLEMLKTSDLLESNGMASSPEGTKDSFLSLISDEDTEESEITLIIKGDLIIHNKCADGFSFDPEAKAEEAVEEETEEEEEIEEEEEEEEVEEGEGEGEGEGEVLVRLENVPGLDEIVNEIDSAINPLCN